MSTHASSNTSPVQKADDMPYKELGKEFVDEFKEDDITGLGAEVAYHLIFAIPPLIVLTVMVAAVLNQFTSIPVEENLRQLVEQRAPQQAQDVLTTIINNAVAQVGGGLLSIGLITTALIALWSASNGVASLMKAFNRTYDLEEGRPFIKKRLVAIGLTLLGAVLVNAALFLSVFAGQIGQWISGWIGLGSIFTTIWPVLSWILAIALFMVTLAVFYYLAPDVEQTFQWVSPGSVVATVLWVVALVGFQIYLTFSNPGSLYGAFGGVIVFLFFLYISSIVLIIGAEVNAIMQTRYDEVTVRYRAKHTDRLINDAARLDAQERAREYDERKGTNIAGQLPDVVTNNDDRIRQARPRQAGQPRQQPVRTAGGVSLAAIGVALGWLLGKRNKEHE